MTSAATNQSLVEVRGRFHRSVQLVRDWQARDVPNGYLATATAKALASRIVQELSTPNGVRAWSITGPYGTGKSSFALFLAKLLGGNGTTDQAEVLLDVHPLPEKRLLPIPLVGNRVPLKPALLEALATSLEDVSPALARDISRKAKGHSIEDEEVVASYERAARAVVGAGYGGILLLLDEFGKFLEYAAYNLDSEDLLVMQSLAETASRSTVPFALITILHTSFADYLDVVHEAERAEWQKVQGRFTDVAFQEPPEQLLGLIGESLDTQFSGQLNSKYESKVLAVVRAEALREARRRMPLEELLPVCAPLHPITALLLWPLFRSKLAQNERSLFSFLTSNEPFGFQAFLDTARWQDETAPLYRIDQLYDYVRSSLGTGAYLGDAGRHWVEVDDALDRLGADAPKLAGQTVKALGLLWMYGAPVGLRASEEAIALALDDPKGVRDALAYLEHMSIVVYRRFEDAFGLWEGSDVDLDARYQNAREQAGRGNLASRLRRTIELSPSVARAHYIRSGTLRYFTIDIVDGSEAALRTAMNTDGGHGEGRITYVLTPNAAERDSLVEMARSLTKNVEGRHQLQIFSFPRPITGLDEALEEVECWRWVTENTPALQGDRVARKELASRLQFARRRLADIAGRVFGLRGYRFEPQSSDWVHGGTSHPVTDARTFAKWLSSLCDQVYSAAPPLHNELLNRNNLSSAAKAALNRLVKEMVAHESSYRFGIEGTPPEVSMYEALFTAGGFHQHQGELWWMGEPNKDWQPVWAAINSFLATTHAGRRPVRELYDILKEPPFGLREGPLPLLLCSTLLAKNRDVVLYYNGLFQPQLYDEILELLVRVPESFEIQEIELTEEGHATLNAIRDVLHDLALFDDESEGSPLLRIVRPLVIAVAKLPPFSKNTSRLDPPEAADLRDAALNATDPHAFLLMDIPRILGIPAGAADIRHELARRLRSCLFALQHAYPNLLDQVETQVKRVLDLPDATGQETRAALARRAQPLKGYSADPDLSLFINEAARTDDRDWREPIARAVLKGKPATTWSDHDVVEFQLRLRQIASDFERLEELVAEKQASGADEVIRVGVLGSRLAEVRHIVSLRQDRVPVVESIASQVIKLLSEYESNDAEGKHFKLAALARAVMHYLQIGEDEDANS
jgi:hypothetical protein